MAMEEQPELEQDTTTKPFIEINILTISFYTLVIGTMFMFLFPFVFGYFHYFTRMPANEVGDAFGGMANPIATLIGIVMTFFAFYIQYKANERQTGELEKQKLRDELRYAQDAIRSIKDDIRTMRYTKTNGVFYSHSEAIYYFMIDHVVATERVEEHDTPKQQYYQISYLLTLFEPLIEEIIDSRLTDRQKFQLLQNLEGVFESSFAFVLRLEERVIREGKERLINGYLKRKVIIPVKKIRMLLKDGIGKYSASEKESLQDAAAKIKGSNFVKQVRYLNRRGTIVFFRDYNDYLKSNPTQVLTEQEYLDYFQKDDQLTKILATEPIRLLMKLDFLEEITFNLPFNGKSYYMSIEREAAEEYLGIDLAEMKIDKTMWRDKFLGKYVYDNKNRQSFIDAFTRISAN